MKVHRTNWKLLALGAIGIVYGDIGTSPIYAMRESFGAAGSLAVNEDNVLGILSMITWALILVVTLKYLVFVMRADQDGEGGILALTSLVDPEDKPGWRGKVLLTLGLFGAALLYGDGMITPAISVLSAIEGLTLAAPSFDAWVIPTTLAILVLLFATQRFGSAKIGAVFGPVMTTWFLILAALGVYQLVQHPTILRALSPHYAAVFFMKNGLSGLGVLGGVFLVATGAEAVYADLGHFGKKPIRVAWIGLVLPALLLNYYGQGALLIADPGAIDDPFFQLAPRVLLYPLDWRCHDRYGHRLPSRHRRSVLPDLPSYAARIRAPHQDDTHLGGRGGSNLRTKRQLGADVLHHGPRARVSDLQRPSIRLRRRRDDDHDHHHHPRLCSRAEEVGMGTWARAYYFLLAFLHSTWRSSARMSSRSLREAGFPWSLVS